MRTIELLAPAANKEIGKQAILHGADAVYIGASSHGARRNAANSIEDIKELVEFAHQFRAKVYVTVNTLVYDSEIETVKNLISDLYKAGVDALIVQDMGVLRMDIPPIELHASTQCDTRTPEKALFLEKVGFSQIVLARELSLDEIKDICQSVTVPVECFVHGALCVSYSGRCQASESCMGRSANRGECSQMCRLPYTLRNADGEVIMKDKYLLSLSDFNASSHLFDLMEAGVSSFKIEGRLKDVDYVKNVTAAYRFMIDNIIAANSDKYRRLSYGESIISFTPSLDKSFNRGFTTYFLEGRGSQKMTSLHTPKSLGEKITGIADLHNGDGISYYNPVTKEYEGVRVNKVEKGRIIPSRKVNIPREAEIRRTFDVEWQKKLAGETAVRRISIDMEIDETGISAQDERGVRVRIPLDCNKDTAQKPFDPKPVLSKLGTTIYQLKNFTNRLNSPTFIPASALTTLRRRLVEALDSANIDSYPYHYRRKEEEVAYISTVLDSRDNVANRLSSQFYKSHHVERIEPALEIKKPEERNGGERIVMTTRYCLRRELGCCKKNPLDNRINKKLKEPLTIVSGNNTFRLQFDCKNCEMNVIHHL